jgi:hypothetical protein
MRGYSDMSGDDTDSLDNTETPSGGISNSIMQLTDIWTGRATYDNDDEWLANVGCMVGELCEAVGYGTATVVGEIPPKR